MSDNLRIWNAVQKTDPAHTKKVEFGRKFTSIDAHWQILRATEQFGPVGEGWRYEVTHSIERLSDEMVLAIADVRISWRSATDDVPRVYGPIRGTCEMWFKNERKGRMEVDEDAPKKAMTDALTKGLSHLGFSADVFLGLFDDNRYVQKTAKEFAANIPASTPPGDFAEEARRDGLTTETRSTYEISKERKAIADLCKTARTAISMAANRLQLKDWWNENKGELIDKLPESDFITIKAEVEAKRDDLPALEVAA